MQKRVGRKKRNSRRYKYTSSTSPVADRNLNSLPLVNEAGCTQCDRRGERSVEFRFFFFFASNFIIYSLKKRATGYCVTLKLLSF